MTRAPAAEIATIPLDALAEWFDAVEARGVRIKRVRLFRDDWMRLYWACSAAGRGDWPPPGEKSGLLFMGVPVGLRKRT